MQIQLLRERFFQIRERCLIEYFRIHCLEIFTVHPTQLLNIKDSRGFAHIVVVKCLDELL